MTPDVKRRVYAAIDRVKDGETFYFNELAELGIESDARAERIAELEARLELLHDSLGSLAPAGTWLCDEVFRPIWQAKHRDVAITVAKIAQPLIAANGLWVGDREMASENAKLREALAGVSTDSIPTYRIPVVERKRLAERIKHFEALYGPAAIYLQGTFDFTGGGGAAFISDREYPVIGHRGTYFTVLVGDEEIRVRVNETAEGYITLKAHIYSSRQALAGKEGA